MFRAQPKEQHVEEQYATSPQPCYCHSAKQRNLLVAFLQLNDLDSCIYIIGAFNVEEFCGMIDNDKVLYKSPPKE